MEEVRASHYNAPWWLQEPRSGICCSECPQQAAQRGFLCPQKLLQVLVKKIAVWPCGFPPLYSAQDHPDTHTSDSLTSAFTTGLHQASDVSSEWPGGCLGEEDSMSTMVPPLTRASRDYTLHIQGPVYLCKLFTCEAESSLRKHWATLAKALPHGCPFLCDTFKKDKQLNPYRRVQNPIHW